MSKDKVDTNIHFLSASDRINYGDLLFPIIFKKILDSKNLKFKNYGIIKSNLSYFGALPTRSYKSLQKTIKKEGGTLVVGGGEVFFGNWVVLYAFINSVYAKLLKSYTLKKIENRFQMAKKILSNGNVLVPFAPALKELRNTNAKILYNAVGGRFNGSTDDSRNQLIAKGLSEANYISVRDKRAQDSLKDFDINAILSPDSALIMSDFFTSDVLETKISLDINTLPEKFIFVQIGKNKSTKNINKFAIDLEKELEKLDFEAVLCPIGMAPNHEDDDVLKVLEKLSSKFTLIIPNNLFDIMYLISKSKCYLGTSLHGLITAQSFNVPFTPLNKTIKKLDAYCKTWTSTVCSGCIDFEDVTQLNTILSSWNFKAIESKTIEQKEMVYSNFNRIIQHF